MGIDSMRTRAHLGSVSFYGTRDRMPNYCVQLATVSSIVIEASGAKLTE
jgi:hypothetical protein